MDAARPPHAPALCVETSSHPALWHPTLMSFVELFSQSPCVFLHTVTFEDFDSTRVQQFWDALKNFTSGEQPLSCSSPTGPGLQGHFFPWECPLAFPARKVTPALFSVLSQRTSADSSSSSPAAAASRFSSPSTQTGPCESGCPAGCGPAMQTPDPSLLSPKP